MANWPFHHFYGQLDHPGVLWPLGHTSFHWPYAAPIGPFGQSFTSPVPRPIPLFWAWGFHLSFQEPLAPQAHPFDYEDFGPFRPPTASTVRRPESTDHRTRSMGPLGPFWPKSNGAKVVNHLP
ncbi:hypothetical protein O181_086204 [Austropuccinia psidii MF-1]|uniref:Uncharacterized protein n=1 Tax=Austropuccinia psidii MF-1 TaxID=1389203 RepID=A0A9Q3IN99_9BASI|nr:hypothetical protein [Austropuccinia psidii MF-1]